jgi:hypothetical protein
MSALVWQAWHWAFPLMDFRSHTFFNLMKMISKKQKEEMLLFLNVNKDKLFGLS